MVTRLEIHSSHTSSLLLSCHVQDATAASHGGNLEAVVEKLTRFRSEVRAFALTRHGVLTTGSPNKPGLYPERIPLLKACDALRHDLAPLGVLIKVCWLHDYIHI